MIGQDLLHTITTQYSHTRTYMVVGGTFYPFRPMERAHVRLPFLELGRWVWVLMRRVLVFDDTMKIRYRGVVGLLMKCTKMDQNAPKWSLYHDRA